MLLSLFFADPVYACDPMPLGVRKAFPASGATGVPLDVRAIAGLLGLGTAADVALEIQRDGIGVDGNNTSWCYPHEGDFERHCWLAWSPTTSLAPETDYRLVVTSTDSHPGPSLRLEQPFRTGTELSAALSGVPTFRITEVGLRTPNDDCEWEPNLAYYFQTTPVALEPQGGSVLHVYELDPTGERDHALVHTLYYEAGINDFRQVYPGEATPRRCFALAQENLAGQLSDRSELCWPEEAGDSGDTGDTNDDTAAKDDSDSTPAAEPDDCACSTGAGVPTLALGAALALTRRRGSPLRSGCNTATRSHPEPAPPRC